MSHHVILNATFKYTKFSILLVFSLDYAYCSGFTSVCHTPFIKKKKILGSGIVGDISFEKIFYFALFYLLYLTHPIGSLLIFISSPVFLYLICYITILWFSFSSTSFRNSLKFLWFYPVGFSSLHPLRRKNAITKCNYLFPAMNVNDKFIYSRN